MNKKQEISEYIDKFLLDQPDYIEDLLNIKDIFIFTYDYDICEEYLRMRGIFSVKYLGLCEYSNMTAFYFIRDGKLHSIHEKHSDFIEFYRSIRINRLEIF